MKSFKVFVTEVYPIIWNRHEAWVDRVKKDFGDDVTFSREGHSTMARKGKDLVGDWHHGDKSGIVYKHVNPK